MAYAEKTTVSVAKTKADIEELVQKYGADQFISGYRGDLAVIGFSMADRQIRFILPLPKKKIICLHRAGTRGGRMMQQGPHGNRRAGQSGDPCIWS